MGNQFLALPYYGFSKLYLKLSLAVSASESISKVLSNSLVEGCVTTEEDKHGYDRQWQGSQLRAPSAHPPPLVTQAPSTHWPESNEGQNGHILSKLTTRGLY